MTERFLPFKTDGVLEAVASKSYLQRALAIAALANGPTLLRNYNMSSDAIAAQNIISCLGAKIRRNERLHIIPGKPDFSEDIILDADESGLSLRMFSFVAALYNKVIQISGKNSLLKRPIKPLVDALLQCGVQVKTTNGGLPIVICGPITKNKIELDGSFSSHMLSGLLIVSPLLEHDTEIIVKNLVSRPYVAMTLNIMRQFGVNVENNNFRKFYIKGRQKYIGQEYVIEGDWSSAANFLVCAAISGKIEMTGLNQNSLQADIKIRDILVDFGAHIKIMNNFISVSKRHAKPFTTDLTDSPDLFPPVVVLAAAANGKSVIIGTKRLIHKESNRFDTLMSVFTKLGVKMQAEDNELHVFGNGYLNGGEVDSFNDHRIAMCSAIAGAIAKSDIIINNADVEKKSHPSFFDDLKKIICN